MSTAQFREDALRQTRRDTFRRVGKHPRHAEPVEACTCRRCSRSAQSRCEHCYTANKVVTTMNAISGDPPTHDEAFLRALRFAFSLLKARARSIEDLRGKLGRRGVDAETTEKVLFYLESRQFVGDQAMARDYIQTRSDRRPIGRRLVTEKLTRMGVGSQAVEAALNDWDDQTEEQRALQALQERWGAEPPPADPNLIRRWLDFLMRRGFEEEAAVRALRGYCRDEIDGLPGCDH